MTVLWNETIARLPGAHLLQTEEWGRIKAPIGWQPHFRTWQDESGVTVAAAQMLVRRIVTGGFAARLAVAYVPRGPLLDWGDVPLRGRVLADLIGDARKRGAMFLKIDPEVPLGYGVPGEAGAVSDGLGESVVDQLKQGGWVFSADQVQYRNTMLADLSVSEEAMLARMKQKARYNVRLAARKGVTVRAGGAGDFGLLYRMYAETARRDGFVIREEGYYRRLWGTLEGGGLLDVLVAEVDGETVAGLVMPQFAGRAIYLHGMSRAAHREKMPSYLLQWEAMRRAKAAGCAVYDLWGAPDVFEEGDGMWGVWRFKEGLGGEVVRHVGAWDYPIRPFWFRVYTRALPRVLDVMRKRGRIQAGKAAGD